MTQQTDFDPNPAAPATDTPDWMYTYLQRDQGATAMSNYRHWSTVLASPENAALWNRMTHDFMYQAKNEMQQNWLRAHYTKRIEETVTGRDRDYLRYKLLAHWYRAKGKTS
jgi:hypothetical protein